MPSRKSNWFELLEHHDVTEPLGAADETPERYAAVAEQRDERFATTHATLGDAFYALGDGVLDGWTPCGVYDLDERTMLEVHVATPVVTASEDQGIMLTAFDQPQPTVS